MEVLKQRTRLLISDYTDREKTKLEDYTAKMDNVYLYYDPDKGTIGVPTGFDKFIKEKFPKAIIKDDLNSYWPYNKIKPVQHNAEPRNQLQKDFISFALENMSKGQKIAGILGPGSGKGQPLYTKIPSPNGIKCLGDLEIGDKIFGSDGRPITVTDIFDQGIMDVYKVTFNDGRYALCDENHLWNVTTSLSSEVKTLPLKEIVKDYKHIKKSRLRDKESGKTNRDPYLYKYRIPILNKPVEYNHREIPIHPYVLGAFIGNGCCRDSVLAISCGDDFIPNKIADLCNFKVKKRSKNNFTYDFYDKDTNKPIHTKDFFKDLPEMINCYSRDKFIPDNYIYNSIEIRMELLRGLMDTDGAITYNHARYHVSYSSCSEKLLKQIKYIIMSLGFNTSNIYKDNRNEKYQNGFFGSILFLVPHTFKQYLFTIPKKHLQALKCTNLPDTCRTSNYLIIKDIKLIKQEKTRCIKVDAEDQLYLTENFIVTHNTFMACYCAIKLGGKTLIVVPTSSIKVQWGETLTGMFKVDPSKVKVINNPRDFINCNADFVIISHGSLSALNKNYDLEKIMKDNKFYLKVIDEVQMFFRNIILIDSSCNIMNNLYLTGTFGRSDEVENNLYQNMFGDLKIFKEQMKKPTFWDRRPGNIYGQRPYHYTNIIWTNSGLTFEQWKSINTAKTYSEREGMWVRYGINISQYMNLVIPSDGTITPFIKTLIKIVQTGEKECQYGTSLILLPTVQTCKTMIEHLKQYFHDKKFGTINSLQSKAENQKNKVESDILVSTIASCGTGFDKKGLSKTYLFSPIKSWILSTQIFYRTRRRDDGKPVYFYDVIDAGNGQLRRWGNGRVEIFREKSIKLKVIKM